MVAAKTVTPNAKLPGTIYSAAEAIEAAGGRALALELDIRAEEQVKAAVEKAAGALWRDRHPGQQRERHQPDRDGGNDAETI